MNSRTKNFIIGVLAAIDGVALVGGLYLHANGKPVPEVLWVLVASIPTGLFGLFQHSATNSQQDRVLGNKITNVEAEQKPEEV